MDVGVSTYLHYLFLFCFLHKVLFSLIYQTVCLEFILDTLDNQESPRVLSHLSELLGLQGLLPVPYVVS
jgi:hypothetical protein